MTYKYGNYSKQQIQSFKKWIQKQIFFLILCTDPKTKEEHNNIDVDKAMQSILFELGGFNSTLSYPDEVVRITNLLEAARLELPNLDENDYRNSTFRKLVLDAGKKSEEIKEV